MKSIYFLAQMNPQVDFIAPNFDSFVNAFAENFVLVIVLFFVVMILAFIFYYACCIVGLAWRQITSSTYAYKDSVSQTEIS